jgi:hypothetical protein
MSDRKLGINLIPRSSWFNNLRSMFPKERWDELRRGCYRKAGYVCEICGGRGEEWPVECHEVWDFSKHGIQRLIRLIALCPMCHRCQHPGLAQIHGEFDNCIKHYMKVNGVSRKVAEREFDAAFEEWEERNETEWKLDISVLGVAKHLEGEGAT